MSNLSKHEIESDDVVIIGGGVIGLTIARALARRGVRNLAVIEKNSFGGEASSAAGGLLAPQVEADRADDFFRLACRSRDLYPEFARELQLESGIDVQLETTGTLVVAFTAKEEAELRSRFVWQQSEGLSVEWLDGDDARGIEPSLSKRVRCALRFPNDFQVDNRLLCEALVIANERLGVRLIDNCEVRSLRIKDGAVQGIEADEFESASKVVIAAGAWSSRIDCGIQIEPVRGQMICFEEAQFARHVIYGSRGYLIPRRDGRLLAGSTSEHVGFDKRVTDDGVTAIKSMAMEIAPRLADYPLVDSWAGFRPYAPDGLPLLGASREIDGVFYASGHYRNGILLAPITGELIAENVTGVTPDLIAPFLPNRFVSEPGTVATGS